MPLKNRELHVVEDVLEMSGGYVLNFSNRDFTGFFLVGFDVDIDAERYCSAGSSKANRLRTFLRTTDAPLLGKVLEELLNHRLHEMEVPELPQKVLARYVAIANAHGGALPTGHGGVGGAQSPARPYPTAAETNSYKEKALDRSTDIEELLARGKSLAAAVSDVPSSDWLEKELNGYGVGDELPSYRHIPSRLRSKRGTHWSDVELEGALHKYFSESPVYWSISQVQNFSQLSKPSAMISPEEAEMLREAAPEARDFQFYRYFPPSSFNRILSSVRTRALDWVLEFEARRPASSADVERSAPANPQEPAPMKTDSRTKPALPKIFIGSTVEALDVARAVQSELEHEFETTLWTQNVFQAGSSTWLGLVEKVRSNAFDFAVLVLGADDALLTRDTKVMIPRDNVLLEFGLFSGALGADRAFFLIDRTNRPKIATDLSGITPLSYNGTRSDGNLHAAVGSACTEIRNAAQKLASG